MAETKPTILVLCTGNSARSQLAEALLRKHCGERFNVCSAGTEPKGVHPLSIRALSEIGIDISNARSKHLDELLGKIPIHIAIIVCGDADKKCPAVWPGLGERLFWPFDDPAAVTGSQEERLASFRRVRDLIDARIQKWLREIPADYAAGLLNGKK
jgi:arsenate reductase (thioredoxin)